MGIVSQARVPGEGTKVPPLASPNGQSDQPLCDAFLTRPRAGATAGGHRRYRPLCLDRLVWTDENIGSYRDFVS